MPNTYSVVKRCGCTFIITMWNKNDSGADFVSVVCANHKDVVYDDDFKTHILSNNDNDIEATNRLRYKVKLQIEQMGCLVVDI